MKLHACNHLLVLTLGVIPAVSIAALPVTQRPVPSELKQPVTAVLNSLQLPFIANAGQTDPTVSFYAQTFAGTVYVTRHGELVYSLPAKDGKPGWSLVESFAGGQAIPIGTTPNTNQVSYIKNQNGKAVTQNAKTYGKLALGNVFKGISVDLVAHGNNVEKVYTVAAGADASQIKMAVKGVNRLSQDGQGALLVETGNGTVRFTPPIAWQEKNGMKTPVQVSYAVANNSYSFQLGAYDHNESLMIDPLLQATYLGGSGEETALEIQVHPITGDVYVLGSSVNPGAGFSNTFPGTTGGWAAIPKIPYTTGNQFLARLTSDLKNLVQATFLNELNVNGFHLKLHPINGDVYLWGTAYSQAPNGAKVPNIPGLAGGAFSESHSSNASNDAVYISRFSADLTQLKQSTYVFEEIQTCTAAKAVAISPVNGNLYMAGWNLGYGCGSEVAVSKITADLKSATSNYFGSSSKNYGYGIAIHPVNGDVYVSGQTTFNDFPATAGGYQPNNNSLPATGMQPDGFIAQLSPDIKTLKQATYLGGLYEDRVDRIVFDRSGNNLFLLGVTASNDFPGLINGAYSKISANGSNATYISKISSDLKTLMQSSIVMQFDTKTTMFVHPLTDEVYAVGDFSIDHKLGNPSVLRFKPDLKFSYGGISLIDPNLNHPNKSIDLSPLTGDIYITGNQNSTSIAFPQTTGGYQATPATATGGKKDIYIARFSSNDIQSNAAKADLELSQTVNTNNVQIDGTLLYTLSVKNNGPDAASSVEITDNFPSTVTIISASNGCSYSNTVISCSLDTLANGASRSVSVTVTPTAEGNLTNMATVAGLEADPSSANNSSSLSVTVTNGVVISLASADLGVGGKVTITGQGFTNKKGTVKIGTRVATIVSWSDTNIVAKLPALKANSYPVKVINKNKTAFDIGKLVVHAPEVSSLSINSGTKNTKIPFSIGGQYFGIGVKPSVYLVSSKKKRFSGSVSKGYNDTNLTVTTPRLKADTYHVLVTNSAGNSQLIGFTVQ